MKRPLAVSAIALIWGIILADVKISHVWGVISVVLSLLAFLLLYRHGKKVFSKFLLLAIPFLLAGYTLHSMNSSYYEKVLIPWEGKTITVEGRLMNEPEFSHGKTRFTMVVNKIQDKQYEGLRNLRLQVSVYDHEPIDGLQYGSCISLAGEIRIPQGRRNFGGFDTRKFLAARGIAGTMAEPVRSLRILDQREASWLKSMGYNIRRGILRALDECLPPRESSVLAGMLIGYTADMPEELEEDFRRAGLSHIMAVSGANIAFLLAPLLWVLQHLGFNRRWSSALAFPMMLFYVFATGMEASVVRAAIMAGVTLTGMLLWRKADIFCSMAAAAIIILIYNSYMLFDLGFILSFAATLSLVIFYKPIFDRLPFKIPKSIRDTLAGTIAAQLGVIPIIAYNFNTFSIISIFSNLLVVPLTGFLTVLGAILAIVGNISVGIGQVVGFFTRITADIILFITEGIAGIPWAEIGIATPDALLVMAYYLILAYLRYGHPRLPKSTGRPVLAGILLLCGVVFVLISVPSRSLRICFADVGQGDCILIQTPQGKNIIIDGGGSLNDENGSYAGERIVVPLLYNLNMTQIDLMIATHGHADHIGGLKTVLDKIPVKKLVVADAPDLEMRELTDYAIAKGVPLETAKEGDILHREDGLTLMALYPLKNEELMPKGAVVNANELSLVTRLEYGEFSAVFTGDIGGETERRILHSSGLQSCDLLKVAHHGSKYSTEELFLKAADPDLAIVMVGQNRYGHPSPDALKRLESQGAMIYQTMESGGILVEAWRNEDRMRVTTVVGR